MKKNLLKLGLAILIGSTKQAYAFQCSFTDPKGQPVYVFAGLPNECNAELAEKQHPDYTCNDQKICTKKLGSVKKTCTLNVPDRGLEQTLTGNFNNADDCNTAALNNGPQLLGVTSFENCATSSSDGINFISTCALNSSCLCYNKTQVNGSNLGSFKSADQCATACIQTYGTNITKASCVNYTVGSNRYVSSCTPPECFCNGKSLGQVGGYADCSSACAQESNSCALPKGSIDAATGNINMTCNNNTTKGNVCECKGIDEYNTNLGTIISASGINSSTDCLKWCMNGAQNGVTMSGEGYNTATCKSNGKDGDNYISVCSHNNPQ